MKDSPRRLLGRLNPRTTPDEHLGIYSHTVLRREWPLIGIAVVATVLRCHQLLDQAPIDDEWHALNQAMTRSMSEILVQFGGADITIRLPTAGALATRPRDRRWEAWPVTVGLSGVRNGRRSARRRQAGPASPEAAC